MRFRNQSIKRTHNQAGPGCLIPFSLVWMAFSSFFIYVGIFGNPGKRSEGWEKVPCVIEKFEITNDPAKPEPFGVDVVFRYFHGGSEHTGTRTGREKEHREDEYEILRELRAKVMAEPEAECLVNPQDSAEAVLRLTNEGGGVGRWVAAIFGGCFFLIGFGLFISAVREIRQSRRKEEAGGTSVTSVTSVAGQKGPTLILVPFFGLFALAGTGLLVGLIVPMWKDWQAAKSWVEVPGEVIWSRTHAHRGSKNQTTYSAQIFYRYEFAGRTYESDRRSFAKVNGSMEKAREVVAKYPTGASVVVHVDPEEPERAVLDRSLGGEAWFSLFPLPFMAVGFGGLFWLFRGGRKKSSGSGSVSAAAGLAALAPGESLRLAPGKGRVLKAVGLLAVAAFWNGIVSVFVVQMFGQSSTRGFSWGMGLFLVPFVIVGLVLIAAFLHQAGALFNPRPLLHLEGGQPRLGVNLSVRYEIPAGATRLKSLRLVLRGEEVATYRRGTNSVTERSIFHEEELLSTELVEMMRSGRVSTRIPADLVPSWKSANNRVEWSLSVEGTIAFWPDISDRHSIEVLPT